MLTIIFIIVSMIEITITHISLTFLFSYICHIGLDPIKSYDINIVCRD